MARVGIPEKLILTNEQTHSFQLSRLQSKEYIIALVITDVPVHMPIEMRGRHIGLQINELVDSKTVSTYHDVKRSVKPKELAQLSSSRCYNM